jgi:hypothetical protein
VASHLERLNAVYRFRDFSSHSGSGYILVDGTGRA